MTKEDIVLTDGQQEGLYLMLEWNRQALFNPTFSLTGRAGTGKTTLINTYLRQCGIATSDVCVTAPTHKAKSVISKHTGKTAETIQKLLGLRLDADVEKFDPEKPVFNPKAQPTISNYKLVVIDEASMINNELYKLIRKEQQMFNVKVLFLGDWRQLPPVNEAISIALKNEGSNYDLTEIIRQDNMNPIMMLLDTIVHDIEHNTNQFKDLLTRITSDGRLGTNVNDKGEGYVFTRNKVDFSKMAIADFKSSQFTQDYEHCKVVAWTNDAVKEWNNNIRFNVFHTNQQIINGDLVMGYKTIVDEFNAIKLINSEDYVVENIREHITDKNIKGRLIDLREAETGLLNNRLFIVDDESILDFVKLYNYYYSNAKAKGGGEAWSKFFKWRNNYLLLKDVYDREYEELYGQKYFVTGKDLDYGYSLTVHKSQGSTYKNVYIDLRDIAKNRNVVERRKLLYVALSRASGKAIIYF